MNVDIFTTGPDAYHAYRIEPPEVVVDIAKRPPDQLADLRLITAGIGQWAVLGAAKSWIRSNTRYRWRHLRNWTGMKIRVFSFYLMT